MATASKFAILGVPEAYELSTDELEAKFRGQSLRYHPDRFVKAPAAERVAALQRGTALNDAYRTLKSPIGRAEHLLELGGKPLKEGEPVEQTFLLEILELRESLQEARAQGDSARADALGDDVRARSDAAMARLPGLFSAGNLDEAKKELIALRYFQRFLDEHTGKDMD